MGIPSVSILLHEIIKLMYHARVRDPIFFRIGTCGGVGIDGGNVIITEEALNADLKPYQELVSRYNVYTYAYIKENCSFNNFSFPFLLINQVATFTLFDPTCSFFSVSITTAKRELYTVFWTLCRKPFFQSIALANPFLCCTNRLTTFLRTCSLF